MTVHGFSRLPALDRTFTVAPFAVNAGPTRHPARRGAAPVVAGARFFPMADTLFIAAARTFDAARRTVLPLADESVPRLHGHRFEARIRSRGAGSAAAGDDPLRLREVLDGAVTPWDLGFLNDAVADPTDAALLEALSASLSPLVPDRITLSSTPSIGVGHAPAARRSFVWRRYRFESAHYLPNVPPGHKCGRMHGHSFAVELRAETTAGRESVTARELDAAWAPLFAEFDHACLNDLPGLENPTSELIAVHVWNRLSVRLPALLRVTVHETASCGAHYDGAGHRIWKDFSLDSAVRRERVPADDLRRRIHGHTYMVRLHAAAPLDTVLGWAIDYGDIKAQFSPLFAQLDHQPLYELPGVGDNDPVSLVHWIRNRARAQCPWLSRIDLLDADGCGATLTAS